ncbi:MAG: hypothetical protein SFW36_01520 [Leptolyngbyaceae cyanobacterium bins.59]|nr:hypothetical protein [Leptolyngbyaceae cyanobacterium bins.59]
MPNPHPVQSQKFLDKQFKPQGTIPSDKPLSKKAIAVKLPEDIDEVVRALPNSAEWLRRVITEAARRELMGETPQA